MRTDPQRRRYEDWSLGEFVNCTQRWTSEFREKPNIVQGKNDESR